MTNYLPFAIVIAPLVALVALVYVASQPSRLLAGNTKTNIDLGVDIDTSDLNLRSFLLGGGE